MTSTICERKREEAVWGRERCQGDVNLMILSQPNRKLQNKNYPSEKSHTVWKWLGLWSTVLLRRARIKPEYSMTTAGAEADPDKANS